MANYYWDRSVDYILKPYFLKPYPTTEVWPLKQMEAFKFVLHITCI